MTENTHALHARDNLFDREEYKGHELRDTCDRRGAYNYRDHPSRIGEKLTWYGLGYKPVKVEYQNHR